MEDIPLLKTNGARSASIRKDIDDPNRIIVTTEFENLEHLKNSQNLTSYYDRMPVNFDRVQNNILLLKD